MKYIFVALFFCSPFFIFSQIPDSAAVAREVDSLLQANRTLIDLREFEEAIRVIGVAENKVKTVFGKNNPLYATCLHYYGRTYQIWGKFPEAEPYYVEAIAIREKISGKNNSHYAASLRNLGGVYQKMHQYNAALPLYLEAKTIQEKVLPKEHPEYASTLLALAMFYEETGHYELSEQMLLPAIIIREKLLGQYHPSYIASIATLANLYESMGRYESAEIWFLKAKSLQEETIDENQLGYLSIINNLAIVYTNMGHYENSEALYLEAKAIKEKTIGKKHPEYALTLTNLAVLYFYMGQLKTAESYYLESKSILEKTPERDDVQYAGTLVNLAILYSEMERYSSAEMLYLEVKSIQEKFLGKGHIDYALTIGNLANLYQYMGRYKEAEQLALESKSIKKKVLGEEHPDYAYALHNIALLYDVMGLYELSESIYLQAKSIWEKALGEEHPLFSKNLNNLAELYYSLGQYESAVPFYTKSNGLQQSLLLKSSYYLSERELSTYAETFIKNLDGYLSFTQYNAPAKLEMLSGSYDNALFHKGFLLEAVSSRNNLTQTDTAAIRLNNLQKSYFRRLSREYAKPIAERDSAHIAEWEEKANTIEKELVRTVAGYGDLIRQVSWEEVKQQLRPTEAAVELVSYRYYTPKPTDSTMYAALVLLPTDTAPHFIPLFEERQLQALFNRPGFDEQLTVKGLYGSRSELLNLLWQPLEPLLRNVKTVYYSPAGLLHRINPAALLDESKQPLSANRQWVRVGSTRELVTGRLADKSFAKMPDGVNSAARTPHSAIVCGGITYDMDSLAFAASNPMEATVSWDSLDFRRKDGNFRYIVEEQSPGTTSGIRGGDDGAWEPLTGSAQEAKQVGALFHNAGFRTDVQQGFDASEERIKKIGKNGPSPRILHLATHGFAYPDPKKQPPKAFADSEPAYKLQDDPMLRSGLVLAGANHYWKNKRPLTNREDGVLVAYEVRDLNLRNTELAVLSACQTGLGDVVGSEGVYGLQRAFRIAGAKFLIVSLWQVPDTQTQELMRLFYENWLDKQESLRDAFNHAQQTLREQEPNPYMWAGFVLIE